MKDLTTITAENMRLILLIHSFANDEGDDWQC